jgi:hypothetical protein
VVLTPPAELKRAALAEHEATLAAARRLAARAVSELGASKVLLFGSRARDDWGRGSDCDIIAVSTRFETMDRIERYNAVFDLWDGPVDIEPIALTPPEYDRSAAGAGIVAMALDGGVVDLA